MVYMLNVLLVLKIKKREKFSLKGVKLYCRNVWRVNNLKVISTIDMGKVLQIFPILQIITFDDVEDY